MNASSPPMLLLCLAAEDFAGDESWRGKSRKYDMLALKWSSPQAKAQKSGSSALMSSLRCGGVERLARLSARKMIIELGVLVPFYKCSCGSNRNSEIETANKAKAMSAWQRGMRAMPYTTIRPAESKHRHDINGQWRYKYIALPPVRHHASSEPSSASRRNVMSLSPISRMKRRR